LFIEKKIILYVIDDTLVVSSYKIVVEIQMGKNKKRGANVLKISVTEYLNILLIKI